MKEIAAAIITETGKLEAKKDHLLIALRLWEIHIGSISSAENAW